MGEQGKNKIGFGDLDTFLKIAPIIGLAILAYLQTLFPSKVEFEKLEDHLIQMDKKITEITILQKDTSNNTSCLLYTSPSPRDAHESRMPSSA